MSKERQMFCDQGIKDAEVVCAHTCGPLGCRLWEQQSL